MARHLLRTGRSWLFGAQRWSLAKKVDLNEERGLVPVDVLVRESSAPSSSVPPKIFEPVGRHFGVPDRVLNVLVPEVMLQGPRVVAVVGQLEPTGVAKHVGMDSHLQQVETWLGQMQPDHERYGELMRIRLALVGQLSSLAVKLRLTPSSRLDRRTPPVGLFPVA